MKNNIVFTIFAILVSIFVIVFGITTYRYYQAIHSDDPIAPYLLVEKGNATITRGEMAIDLAFQEKYDIHEGDIVITRDESLALVAWPDHSTTRLGPNSRLTIERMRVADDYSKIELVAKLENGKAWTNIVRTLYPDSRIEFLLPKVGTVAGVRGTVFEINLDANYIHSVDHSVTLKNSLGALVTLMPGEAVRASNIFEKITEGLDTAWMNLNQAQDAIYTTLRDTQMKSTYILLSGKTGILNAWDNLVRWILSWFKSFQDIAIIQAISSGERNSLVNYPQETIMKWYQAFQGKELLKERDQIRGAIFSLQDNFTNGEKIIESLTRGAMWDMMSASGITLTNATDLLDNYAKKTGTTLDTLQQKLNHLDATTITAEGRALFQKIIQ